MVTDFQRKIIIKGLGVLFTNNPGIGGQPFIFGKNWIGKIILKEIFKRQTWDDQTKHAPACPENNYHRQRLVFRSCTCGAKPKDNPND